MLYTKNGSIPKEHTDGTDGWIEVIDPPVAPEGYETIWWYPPGWIVRPIMPEHVEGYCWSWSQSEEKWTLCTDHNHSSENISISLEETVQGSGTSNDSITLYSAIPITT